MKDNQPTMREKAQCWLAPTLQHAPHAQNCTHYGDRIEMRRLWAYPTDPESIGLYAALNWMKRKYNPLGR